ncbi:hypothetical protein LTR16_000894 [Cryomyces antarcticus]|uniref:Peptidase A1 domain-containing protein n=1 Tax=Cryomyces antarcticus TaxID=329879 RepID=A0ABR0LQN8_9PEZI|nr:hypothetical protein LTR39_000765 [Cryomyces antarcticus]KAK5018989.1 hypothetical protein LTR60_001275 [Cryomyces antarcticus]KAK5201946.1 hypothetical protein LTR16_000894 [Cryomyces antarcticus]
MFGFDTIGLQIENSGGVFLPHQVVAGTPAKDFWLGYFGLDPKPANFSDFDGSPIPSYIQTLKDRSLIPSLSFGYTAGAAYRFHGIFGSLVLGGFDRSRYQPNNSTFAFDPNDSQRFTVGIQSVLGQNTLLNGTVALLKNGIFSSIDSTFPYIWLPTDDCERFAEAFGLTYDSSTDLYVVNDSIHTRLQQLQPTVTFNIGVDAVDNSSHTGIVLPYSAFDLQASYPLYSSNTRYFPIRRAANSSQYTIGRAFLQEAYIVADYERSTFAVGQAVFRNPMPVQDIVTIPSVEARPVVTPQDRGHRPSTGALVGIVISVVATILILVASGAFLWRRRHQTPKTANGHAARSWSHDSGPTDYFAQSFSSTKVANPGSQGMRSPPALYEADAGPDANVYEMPERTESIVHELPGSQIAKSHELPSDECAKAHGEASGHILT